MEKVMFQVKGAENEVYDVSFSKVDATNINAYCSCKESALGHACEHRMAILHGNDAAVVSDNKAMVQQVRAWLPGTDIDDALMLLSESEAELEAAKRKVQRAKKFVAQCMRF